MGLGEYVQVFRGMFVKLGITGKELSAFGGFAFSFSEGKRGLVSNLISIFLVGVILSIYIYVVALQK